MIRTDGFSGIVATTWADASRAKMTDRSDGGVPFVGISHRSKRIVVEEISRVVPANARQSCTGRTIAVDYKNDVLHNIIYMSESKKKFLQEVQERSVEGHARALAMDALIRHCRALGMTSPEFARASLLALGRPMEGTVRQEVYDLSEHIASIMKEAKLTEDHLEELAQEMFAYEHPDMDILEHVGMLNVSGEEKEMILDVFEEQRPGRLVVVRKKDGAEQRGAMVWVGESDTPRDVADTIIELLARYVQDDDIRVIFFPLE